MIEKPWEKKNQLLDDYNSKKITLEELQKECAYWYLDCFDEISPRAFPSMPEEYRDFMAMPFEKRNKISNEFHNQPKVKDYLEQKQQVKNENKSKVYWLKEHLSHIPESDFVARSRFNEKLNDFEYNGLN